MVRTLYYGTRLSSNLSLREPEGYLLCLNVPVARSGTQEYLPEELGLPAGGEVIPVYRPEEEVFSPECMASFEGMIVTNDHPREGVNAENTHLFQRGHAHNVRRGSGEEADLLLADLMITDPALIDAILHQGKREISCGYTYVLCEEDGQFVQRRIRGNHVAVVDAGRAGPRVSIRDRKSVPDFSYPEKKKENGGERTMKKSLAKKLVRMARDGDAEMAEEILEAILSSEEEEGAAEVAEVGNGTSGTVLLCSTGVEQKGPSPCSAAVVTVAPGENAEEEKKEVLPDEDPVSLQILERLDRLIALLAPAECAAGDEEGEAAADPVEEVMEAVEEVLEAEAAAGEAPEVIAAAGAEAVEEIAELVEEIVGEEETEGEVSVEPTDAEPEENGECISSRDAIRAALSSVRPALMKMPVKQRRKVAADIAARVYGKPKKASAYVALAAARDRKVRKESGTELGVRIMEARNPNYKGGH